METFINCYFFAILANLKLRTLFYLKMQSNKSSNQEIYGKLQERTNRLIIINKDSKDKNYTLKFTLKY